MAKIDSRALRWELEASFDDGLCIDCGAPVRYCYCTQLDDDLWWYYLESIDDGEEVPQER